MSRRRRARRPTTRGDVWIEEYIVDPPSHILNGFIWALWGVYDYARGAAGRARRRCGTAASATLEARLDDFDTGWWSLYEAPTTAAADARQPLLSPLHVVQLRVLHG